MSSGCNKDTYFPYYSVLQRLVAHHPVGPYSINLKLVRTVQVANTVVPTLLSMMHRSIQYQLEITQYFFQVDNEDYNVGLYPYLFRCLGSWTVLETAPSSRFVGVKLTPPSQYPKPKRANQKRDAPRLGHPAAAWKPRNFFVPLPRDDAPIFF